jgi:cobalt/nickel transport protein
LPAADTIAAGRHKAMRGFAAFAAAAVVVAGSAAPASAHFQEIIPSTDRVTEVTGGEVVIDLVFTHPMERGPVMPMDRPVRVGVQANGRIESLDQRLQPKTIDGSRAWQAAYVIRAPGNYVFFVEPQPYWEPAEQKMIVHYAKVVVDAFGAGEGWDAMVGLPVEIRPLVRPYGVWAGNLFRGIVERGGRPVAFAEIEVEWRNDGSITPPSDAFVTQVIKANSLGEFAYALPRPGWWGFAALVEAEARMRGPDGSEVPVEEGALMWVRAVEMK